MERLTEEHLKSVCRFGKGEETCSFLTMSVDGFECAKGTSIEPIITQRRAAGTMVAKGDNCEGRQGAVRG